MNPAVKASNPLAGFMRQPKIYIRLPSGGEFWPAGSLEKTETNEYPVYSMTAKDELMLKVPDALMNGQALVDIVQHCVPNIKNAWQMPNLDLDVILIAIRIATYGEKMSIPVNLGKDIDLEYELDLNLLLDQLMNQISWEPAIPLQPELTVYVRPLNYKQITESALKTFETQRLIETASNSSMSDEEKLKIFNESFAKLNDITLGIIQKSVFAIETSEGSTDNPKHIQEFMDNIDKEMYDAVKNRVEEMRNANNIKPIEIETTPEMREKGITDDVVSIPLSFDPTSFFG